MMTYTLSNGKIIHVDEKQIEKSMKIYGITKDEALKLWLEDEGYMANAEIESLTKKAKENKVSHDARTIKPTEKVKRERKPDTEKEDLVSLLADFCKDHAENVVITNVSKMVEFDIGENHFTLNLVRQRKKKK